MPDFSVDHPYPSVAVIKCNIPTVSAEQWFLLRSDAHHDNVYCNRDMEKKHLDQALERGAGIIDNGDQFCAMQGKWDRRADQDQLRPEYRGNNYLDKLVDEAVEFYAPYAKNWIINGHGNHETSIDKYHQTDLTERLCTLLNYKCGTKLRTHGYAGWIVFCVELNKREYGGARRSVRMFRHHGYDGASPVTRGVIHTNRMAVWLPDANIVLSGHSHNEWVVPLARERIGHNHKRYIDEQIHVKVPGYKGNDAKVKGAMVGWEVERGFAPTTSGAAWLRLYKEGTNLRYEIQRAT